MSESVTASILKKTDILATPTNLRLNLSETSVTAVFDESPNANLYVVFYSTDSNFSSYRYVTTVGNTASVSRLSGGETYYFRVQARDTTKTYFSSDYSNVVSVRVPTTETKSTVVTTLEDIVDEFDGLISLREAIAYAGEDGLGTVITFDAAPAGGTIHLSGTELVITKPLTIDASAYYDTNTDQPGISVDAGGKSRVFIALARNFKEYLR